MDLQLDFFTKLKSTAEVYSKLEFSEIYSKFSSLFKGEYLAPSPDFLSAILEISPQP